MCTRSWESWVGNPFTILPPKPIYLFVLIIENKSVGLFRDIFRGRRFRRDRMHRDRNLGRASREKTQRLGRWAAVPSPPGSPPGRTGVRERAYVPFGQG